MPSNISINIQTEKYLISYFEGLYGNQPIVLPKKAPWSLFLNENLRKAPVEYRNQHFGENNLSIRLPYFEDKNVNYNFYLSDCKQRIFSEALRNSFKVMFRKEIDKTLSFGLGITIKDAIYNFMEDYNLSEDAYDMLIKDYGRYRKTQKEKQNRNVKIFTNNSSV